MGLKGAFPVPFPSSKGGEGVSQIRPQRSDAQAGGRAETTQTRERSERADPVIAVSRNKRFLLLLLLRILAHFLRPRGDERAVTGFLNGSLNGRRGEKMNRLSSARILVRAKFD